MPVAEEILTHFKKHKTTIIDIIFIIIAKANIFIQPEQYMNCLTECYKYK